MFSDTAMMMKEECLVVSPLVALMKDQVANFKSKHKSIKRDRRNNQTK
jgi:superfamily II DNA helicase RecQ